MVCCLKVLKNNDICGIVSVSEYKVFKVHI